MELVELYLIHCNEILCLNQDTILVFFFFQGEVINNWSTVVRNQDGKIIIINSGYKSLADRITLLFARGYRYVSFVTIPEVICSKWLPQTRWWNFDSFPYQHTHHYHTILYCLNRCENIQADLGQLNSGSLSIVGIFSILNNIFKYHDASCTDGKISVRIIYFYYLFCLRRPTHKLCFVSW